jgi:kynurenine formamidase
VSNRNIRFSDLPLIDGTDERHAWGVFGDDDELGSLNRLSNTHVVEAGRLISSGRVFNLNLPLNLPGSLGEGRDSAYRHHVDTSKLGRDDKLDNFYLQGSSQWDGLRHIRFRQHGYYGGRQEADLDNDNVLGIDRVAAKGVVGRGVLLDVADYVSRSGSEWNPGLRNVITTEILNKTAASQGTELAEGDILLIRTGWVGWYLRLSEADRKAVPPAQKMSCPGLDADRSTAEWLWNTGIAAVAMDNVAVEALPIDRSVGFLHHRTLTLLGFLLGELWSLDELAASCREDGRYSGFLVSVPLNLPLGAGSPSNAYLIK